MFAAQRQAQNSTRAFLQLLQSASPAVTSQTSWEEVQSCLGSDPLFQAVPAHQQLQIFQSYQAAVRKLEAAQRQRAAAAFQVRGVPPGKALAVSGHLLLKARGAICSRTSANQCLACVTLCSQQWARGWGCRDNCNEDWHETTGTIGGRSACDPL